MRIDQPELSQHPPIVPMAHGDLHRLVLPHLERHVPIGNAGVGSFRDQRSRLYGGPRVLDLGAGTGSMSALMRAAGYDVEACDLEPGLFQCAGTRCRQVDMNGPLPYDDAAFDAVVCIEVLEHVDGHERLFREIERILKPGGLLLFTTPNVLSIKSRISFFWTGFENSFFPLVDEHTPQEWHISGYGGDRYRFVLGLAGLELHEITCDRFSWSSLAWGWLVPLMKLRTRLRHGRADGAALNNSLAALLGRTMIGIAVKPQSLCATARGGEERDSVRNPHCLPSNASEPSMASSASHDGQIDRYAASSGTRALPGLTVIIPCKNEREHIEACIASVAEIADEVLVADSGSTDGTRQIARELGCRIVEREYRTSGDFKNWAIPQATHEWVLVLDADERVTPALAAEIRRVLTDPRHDGYWIYRLNHFLGQPIRFGFWRGDRCLRLFRRDLGRYVGRTDHAEVTLSRGTTGRLRERMVHYTCSSYEQYLPKLERYARVQAEVWHEQGRRASLLQLLFRGPLRFVQGYLWRLGLLDGLAGLQVCVLIAYLSYLKFAYLWQLEHARDWRELERSADESPAAEQSDRNAA